MPELDARVRDRFELRVERRSGAMPLEGARVALDTASGVRTEGRTDAAGLISFDVDWRDGPIDVVAHAEGMAIEASVGITRERYDAMRGAGPFTLRLSSAETPPGISVRGTIRGVGAGHDVYVYNSVTSSSDYVSDYALAVPRDRPFSVLVIEVTYGATGRDIVQTVHRMVRVGHPGSPEDIVLNIDLDAETPVPTMVFTGSFRLPVYDPGSFFDIGPAWVGVAASDFRPLFGVPSLVERQPDGRTVNYVTHYMLPPERDDLMLVIDVHAPDGRASDAFVPFPPSEGMQDVVLLPPPTVEMPTGAFLRTFDDVVFDNASPLAEPTLYLESTIGLAAAVAGPPGATRVALPELPSGVDPTPIFAGGSAGSVYLCIPDTSGLTGYDCTSESRSAGFPVDP